MILSFMKKISLYFYQKLFNQRYNSDFYLTQNLLTKARHNAFILNKKHLLLYPRALIHVTCFRHICNANILLNHSKCQSKPFPSKNHKIDFLKV